MQMAIWRGRIEQLTGPDQHGAAECRVGNMTVRLPSDLSGNLSNDDLVLVAGNTANEVLRAMAVHNLTREKMSQIDPTNQVLLTGLFGFIGLMSLAIGWQYPMSTPFIVLNALAVIAAVGALRSIARLFRVAQAASWIRYPDIAERG